MKRIKITDELLALFLDGKTTLIETYAILKAAQTDWNTRFVLRMAKRKGIIGLNPYSNQSAQPVCQLFALHSRHLPAERLAASNEANDCVVKCEQYILEKRGLQERYEELVKQARCYDWLQKEGTPLYNIGRLSELASLSVSRQFHGSIEILLKEMIGNCSIIVALNDKKLVNEEASTAVVNHAVVVLEIDEEEGYVELYDPQSANPTDRYSIEAFLRAWEPAKNFFVSIIERGVRPYTPHPEDVENIPLPEGIAPLADMLAENAHDIWATDRLAEAEEKKAKGEIFNPYAHQFMEPFSELPEEKRTSDYTSSLNTIKLLYKLGFKIVQPDKQSFEFKPNVRTTDGQYIPHPINVDDVVLPKDIVALTEYIAENTHEEWAKQRFEEGWTFAPKKDEALMQNPDLIPYCELLDSEKEYDRKMAMNTLKVLYKLGYKIEKS